MPMVDYQCPKCDYRFEEFHHEPPVAVPCPRMVGDAETCGELSPRRNSFPGEYRPTNAQRFPPIVLYERENGEFYFDSESPEPNAKRIEITNSREGDYWTKRINDRELEKTQANIHNNKLFFEERSKDLREQIDKNMKCYVTKDEHGRERIVRDTENSGRARWLRDMAQRFRDKKHEEKYDRAMRCNPNFHINVLSFDQQNRMPYWDGERQKKV